jgi:hypothetical protein
LQQHIERQAGAPGCLALRSLARGKTECAVLDRQEAGGRYDVEVVALDTHAVRRLRHGHGCVAGQQLGHQALMRRVEVLDQDEGHRAGIGKRIEKLGTRFQPTGRRTDAYDRKVHTGCRMRR